MSQRCSICDFSPNLPSVFHEGLVTSDLPVRNSVRYRKSHGDYICAHCESEIRRAQGKKPFNEQ